MPELREHLQNLFGLDDFRPAQREVIEDVLRGQDVLCVMPTGAGKSLCYQLPATVQGGLTIVVSPLISLMEDQVQQLRDEGIAAAFLNSSLSAAVRRETMQQLRDGFEGLLYVAPERFSSPDFQELLNRIRPKLFAVDEAHCISRVDPPRRAAETEAASRASVADEADRRRGGIAAWKTGLAGGPQRGDAPGRNRVLSHAQ